MRPMSLHPIPGVSVLSVSGATMSGMVNPNSKTNARNIILSRIEAEKPEKIIMCLGEVDVGYLAIVESSSEIEVIEKIKYSTRKYLGFLNEISSLPYVNEVYASTIYPPIMSDENMPRSKIVDRRRIKYTVRERAAFVVLANKLIMSSWERVLDVHRFFLARMEAVGNFSHINPKDHHFSSTFYIKTMIDALVSQEFLENNSLSCWDASLLRIKAKIYDLTSFVK